MVNVVLNLQDESAVILFGQEEPQNDHAIEESGLE